MVRNVGMRLGIGLLVLVVFLMIGCGQASAPAPAANVSGDDPSSVFIGGGEDEVYYMITFVSGVEYWVPVYEMFKQAGAQLNVQTVYTGTPEYDLNAQMAVFEQVLATRPAGIALCPINGDAFADGIQRALDMGVSIMTFATTGEHSNELAYITSDNVNEGYMAADALAEDMGGRGEVAVLENPGQDNHDLRIRSFIERLETRWPDVRVVARAASNQDPDRAYTALKTMVQANPNIGGVFMPEASSGMGAAQAAIELDTGIRVLCVDVNESILDMIKEGKLFGAINPNQGIQGYFSMLTLYLAHHGLIDPMNDYLQTGDNPVRFPLMDNGLAVITQENADSFYLGPYLQRRNSRGISETSMEFAARNGSTFIR